MFIALHNVNKLSSLLCWLKSSPPSPLLGSPSGGRSQSWRSWSWSSRGDTGPPGSLATQICKVLKYGFPSYFYKNQSDEVVVCCQ